MASATFASLWMREPWQYVATWGVISGIGSGAVASVMGAAVVNRWFATRQGLIMGALTASTATGSLIFLPFMAWLSRQGAWQPVVWFVSLGCAALIPVVALLMPEHPGDIGTERFGAVADSPPPKPPKGAPSVMLAFSALRQASASPTFWLLFGTFFVCGLTTNGLVGTHLIAYCGDHGIPPVKAAGLLSLMGLFDLFGTTGSGWLTDRHDPRKLLFVYYGLRGLSLMALPFLDFRAGSLTTFAIFYGLDWIATVPPTVKLATLTFGERDAPIIFGWVFVGHQLGAATAAFAAGLIRSETGSYGPAFLIAGAFGVAAALAVIGWKGSRPPVLANAAA
jgi:predicted MFS family arabinose efflux permease